MERRLIKSFIEMAFIDCTRTMILIDIILIPLQCLYLDLQRVLVCVAEGIYPIFLATGDIYCLTPS